MNELMERRDDSVRPSILLLCAAFLVGAAFLVYKVATLDASPQHASVDQRSRWIEEPAASPNDSWHHRDWRPQPGQNAEWPPGPGPSIITRDNADPGAPSEPEDPQLAAMRRSFHLGTGDAGTPLLPFYPTTRPARLLASEGSLHLGRNAHCDVRVLPVEAGQFNCLVRVMCDGRVIYPNNEQTAGYAPCDVQNGQPMTAIDESETGADGDPLVRLDLRRGTLEVQDYGSGVDGFRATLQIGP